MRRFFFMMAACFAINAQAAQPGNWFDQMDRYQQEIQTYSNGALFWSQFENYGLAAVGCVSSSAISAVAFVSDTFPLTNPVAEWVGNQANAKYQSYQNFWSWQTLADAGRGATGGALIGGYESLEFVVMWLSGDTSRSYAQLQQVYASSFATLEGLFAKEGVCVSNIVKVAIVRAESRRRAGVPINYTPMYKR